METQSGPATFPGLTDGERKATFRSGPPAAGMLWPPGMSTQQHAGADPDRAGAAGTAAGHPGVHQPPPRQAGPAKWRAPGPAGAAPPQGLGLLAAPRQLAGSSRASLFNAGHLRAAAGLLGRRCPARGGAHYARFSAMRLTGSGSCAMQIKCLLYFCPVDVLLHQKSAFDPKGPGCCWVNQASEF